MSVSRLISMPGEISIAERRVARERQEALGDRPQERGVLRLEAVEEDVRPKVNTGHARPSLP